MSIPARQVFVIELVTKRDGVQGVAALDGVAPAPPAWRRSRLPGPARATTARATGITRNQVQTLEQRHETDQPQRLLVKFFAAAFVDAASDTDQLLRDLRAPPARSTGHPAPAAGTIHPESRAARPPSEWRHTARARSSLESRRRDVNGHWRYSVPCNRCRARSCRAPMRSML